MGLDATKARITKVTHHANVVGISMFVVIISSCCCFVIVVTGVPLHLIVVDVALHSIVAYLFRLIFFFGFRSRNTKKQRQPTQQQKSTTAKNHSGLTMMSSSQQPPPPQQQPTPQQLQQQKQAVDLERKKLFQEKPYALTPEFQQKYTSKVYVSITRCRPLYLYK